MPDYSKSSIYQLISENGLVYVGSTTETLSRRLAKHKSDYKLNKKFTTSKKLFENGAVVKIELIEKFPCNDIDELNKREGFWIRELKCVNKCIMGRTRKEWYNDNKEKVSEMGKVWYEKNKEKVLEKKKDYYENNSNYMKECNKKWRENNPNYMKEYLKEYQKHNKDKISEIYKKYYQGNKEKILEKRKEKVECECGSVVSKSNLTKHKKSKKHIKYEEQLEKELNEELEKELEKDLQRKLEKELEQELAEQLKQENDTDLTDTQTKILKCIGLID